MKTTKKITVIGYRLWVMGIILLLTSTAQAVDFKNSYRGMEQKTSATEYRMATTATAPMMGFQSTSVYSGQWNQDAQQSMLNADGSVNSEAYMGGENNIPNVRPRKISNPDDDDEIPNPLGDVLWPLMALAMLYAGVRRIRVVKWLNR